MFAQMKRPVLIRAIELVSLAAFLVLFVRQVQGLAAIWQGALSWLIVLPGALVGYFVSDVVSGLGHWFCDTFFEEDTPVIGRMIIAPFREHHRDPMALTRHGLAELTGNSALVLSPVLLYGPTQSLFYQGFILAFAFGIMGTNLFHAWAHMENPGRLVRLLQGAHVILTRAHHARHHRGAHDEAYCVTTGWANPLLESFGFFPIMQKLLVLVGVRVRKAT